MTEQIRLGDLLTRAGLLRPEDLREGMLIAKQQSLPVGRVLIMAEFITEPSLQAAVQAQSLLKDGVIDLESAMSALQVCAKENISLDDALGKQGWKDKTNAATNKLGGLLTEAGLISQEQLEQGLNQCQMSGLPLGRVLVAMGFMSEQLLAAALNAQILIRDNKIQRDLAIQGLRACRDRQISIEQSLSGVLQMPIQDTVRLGELFVLAGLLDQDNLMQAVELGLTESKPIGQVLVEHKMISEQLLEKALSVQKLVTAGTLKKEQCGQVLASVSGQGLTLEEAMQKLEPQKSASANALPLYQFLQLAGLITAKDIEEALKLGSRDTELMGRMLLLTGSIDQTSLGAAARLNEMIARGILKAEQAILAMGLCQNRKCSVEQAFKSLGWGMALDQGQATNMQETIPPSALMNVLSQATGSAPVHAASAPNTSVDSLSTGQFQSLDSAASGQYQAVPPNQVTASGQHQAVPANQSTISGQYQAVQPNQAATSGQYQAIDPTASGQYQAQGQSGEHPPVQDAGVSGEHAPVTNDQSGTATTDVPIISINNMLLSAPVPEAFDEPPAASAAAEPAPLEEEAEDETDEDGKKKKGGGGKKRLADLMP